MLIAGLLLFGWLARARRGGVLLAMATVAVGLVDSAILGFLGQQAVGLLRPGEYLARLSAGDLARFLSLGLRRLRRGPSRPRPPARPGPAADRLLAGLPADRRRPLPRRAGRGDLLPGAAAGRRRGAALARRWERSPPRLAAWVLLFLTWAPLLHLSEILLDLDYGWIFAALAALILWPA